MLGADYLLGPALATLATVITTAILLLWYLTKNHDYWKKRNVPYVKPYPIVGTLFQQFFKPLHEVEFEWHRKYGNIFGHFEGSDPVLSVAEPDLLRDILVKDFQYFFNRRDVRTGNIIGDSMVPTLLGEDWKRVRTIITPTFTTGKLKRMVSIFKGCSKTLIENYKKMSKNGPIDVKKVYGAYSMDVIASAAFSTKLDSHNDPENKFAQTARNVFGASFTWRLIIFFLAPWFMKMFGISVFPASGLEFFRSVTLEIIKERKRTGQTRNDFLQLLMDTAEESKKELNLDMEDEESEELISNYGESGASLHTFKTVTKKNLSMDELVAQCVIFFIAGYETTANTLSLCSYNLALNPDIQDKVHEEVAQAIKDANGELTYEAIQGMRYLDNVISETLRICPPGTRLERTTEMDYKLSNTGITIPKGMLVTIPTYAIHKNPLYFPNPEKFDPDRFNPEERDQRHPYSYLPFGAGPRNCLGMRFALIEIKVCLVYIIANFKIKRCSKTKVPLSLRAAQGMFQPKEVTLEFEIRPGSCLLK